MKGPRGVANLWRVTTKTPFGLFAMGNFASLVGFWMQRISVGWITWEMTQSGGWLGAMAFADLFPSLIVGPLAGAAADRWSRVVMMRVIQFASAIAAAVLTLLYFLGWLDLWTLLCLSVFMGAIAAAGQPLRMSIVTELVGREDLAVVVAVNSMVFNVARFVGPAIASLLIVSVDVGAALAVHAFTYLVFLWLLLRLPAKPASHEPTGVSLFGEIAEGVQYLARHPGLAPLIGLSTIVGVTVRPVAELLPGFAEDVFQSGAAGLAVLSSSIGIGAMAGGLVLAGRATTRGMLTIILWLTVLASVGVMAFSAISSLWLGALILFGVGACMVTSGVSTLTLMQFSVPDRLRGRVVSSYGIINRAGPAFGALIVGLLSELVGLQLALAFGGPFFLLVWLMVVSQRQRIRASLPVD